MLKDELFYFVRIEGDGVRVRYPDKGIAWSMAEMAATD